MSLRYRKDIDGLRAVAVLAVVIFHSGTGFQFDGFVGVDIFFVISGYLITGIIYKEIENKEFSFKNFYIRRIKRILPAFFAVVFVSIIIGMLLMLPNDIKSLGKSAFSGVVSASNIYFWYSEDTSYFARSSELIPLLHTWSLGVEEQFYMIWPIIMIAAYSFKGRKGVLVASVVIAVISFSFAEYTIDIAPSFSYYMLPTRAGELLIGSLVFLQVYKTVQQRSYLLYESASFIGVFFIVYSLFFSDASISFPGINAIYPCLGAALILYGGAYKETMVSRFLSISPLVFIGLISYSLYLWHWPVLAYARYLYASLSIAIILICLFFIFAVSIASYRYIEIPFRRIKYSDSHVFGVYLFFPAFILIPLTLYLYKTDGLHGYIAENEAYVTALKIRNKYTKPAFHYNYVCQTDNHGKNTFNGGKCVIGNNNLKPEVLIWGDSHAAHYVGFFDVLFKESDISLRNLEVGSCPPVLRKEIDYGGTRTRKECGLFREQIKGEFGKYDYVLIGTPWQSHFDRDNFKQDVIDAVNYLVDKNIRVVLLGQIPQFNKYDRNCALRNERFLEVDCEKNSQSDSMSNQPANDFLIKIASSNEMVSYFNINHIICQPKCSPYRDGVPIYYDTSHISIYGSRLIGKEYLQNLGYIPTNMREFLDTTHNKTNSHGHQKAPLSSAF